MGLEPGKELNIMIAKEVLKQTPCDQWYVQHHYPAVYMSDCGHNGTCYPAKYGPPEYSTNHNAAFYILEHLNKQGIFVNIRQEFEDGSFKEWVITRLGEPKIDITVTASSLPYAICLFALEMCL